MFDGREKTRAGTKKGDSGSYRNITIRTAMTFFIKTSY